MFIVGDKTGYHKTEGLKGTTTGVKGVVRGVKSANRRYKLIAREAPINWRSWVNYVHPR